MSLKASRYGAEKGSVGGKGRAQRVGASGPYTRRRPPQQQQQQHDRTSDGRRVYVGNLSWDVSWQDLKDHMKACGNVLRADVLMENEKRSKGCGIVEYSSSEEAQQAIDTLTNTELKGRPIFVREDREAKGVGAAVPSRSPKNSVQQHQQLPHPQSVSTVVVHAAPGASVYVGNLSWDVAWQDLKDHFKQAGNVVRADVLMEGSGRSKGCGLVVFSTAAEASQAIATLNDTELKGRPIFVREDRETGSSMATVSAVHPDAGGAGLAASSGPGRTVYVGNLSWQVQWQDLKDHFRQVGNVVRADVMSESSGRSKGCGIVEFSSAAEANEAIVRLNDTDLKGRLIFVREDRENGSTISQKFASQKR